MFRAHLTAAQVLTEVVEKDASLVVHLGDISVSFSSVSQGLIGLPNLCSELIGIGNYFQSAYFKDATMSQSNLTLKLSLPLFAAKEPEPNENISTQHVKLMWDGR